MQRKSYQNFVKGRHHNRNKKKTGEGANGSGSQSKMKETEMYGGGIFFHGKQTCPLKLIYFYFKLSVKLLRSDPSR